MKLDDGALRIFINTKGTNKNDFSKEFIDFMEYLTNSTDEVAERVESERIRTINDRIKKIKLSERVGVKYMKTWEEKIYIREEGREIGLAAGGEIYLIKLVIRKLEKGMKPKEIAQELDEDEQTINNLCEVLNSYPGYDARQIYDELHRDDELVSDYL